MCNVGCGRSSPVSVIKQLTCLKVACPSKYGEGDENCAKT